MTRFEIKNRLTDLVMFNLETESMRLCIEAAVKGGADLFDADLRGADLRGADLFGANLRGADLFDADLRDADLRDANLRDANLRGADLFGAGLFDADLRDANLRDANLRGADLFGADLFRADLRGAKLKHENTDLVLVGGRPLLQIGPIGSRLDYLSAYLTDHGIYVRTGCFWDTLAEFRSAVAQEHGDSVHAIEYGAAIALVEAHATHWTPAKTSSATGERV